MGRVSGKVVLITGTGGSMGREAAVLFAREGATVVGCDVNAEAAAEAVDRLSAEGLQMHSTAPIDVANPEECRNWIETAATAHGRIDVLYNNAARGRFDPFGVQSLDDYHYTVHNVLDIVWHACQAAWPFLSTSHGVIINVGSLSGLAGTRDIMQAAHAAAKGAVISLSRQLAAEGAELGIRVNSISPGVIATPLVKAQLAEAGENASFASMMRASASRDPGQPIDVAYAALFLASDEARYINGSNLVIDGGSSILFG